MQVWKFSVPVESLFTIKIPRGGQILSCQTQFGAPQIWALVDENEPPVERYFAMLGTGHPAPEHGKLVFIDTFQLSGGSLVFHVFEIVSAWE